MLDAWNAATERLQRTHEALREEVHRLTNELEVKNRELARKNRLADLGQDGLPRGPRGPQRAGPGDPVPEPVAPPADGRPDALRIMDKVEAGFTSLGATVNDLLSFT